MALTNSPVDLIILPLLIALIYLLTFISPPSNLMNWAQRAFVIEIDSTVGGVIGRYYQMCLLASGRRAPIISVLRAEQNGVVSSMTSKVIGTLSLSFLICTILHHMNVSRRPPPIALTRSYQRRLYSSRKSPNAYPLKIWPLFAITAIGSLSYYYLIKARVGENQTPKNSSTRF